MIDISTVQISPVPVSHCSILTQSTIKPTITTGVAGEYIWLLFWVSLYLFICIVIINDSGVMRLDISYNMSISCVCMSVY